MRKKVAKILAFVGVLFGMDLTAAHAADITFNVNLHYRIQQGQFTAGTDAVVVFSSFSASGVALTDPDGDKIYSATVTSPAAVNAQLTYNYRYTHGGATVNETVAARKYVVQSYSSANVLDNWFNDQPPPYPYANFFASSVKTIPGEVVRFNDSSQGGAATGWNWSFPGANPASSTAQNPTTTWATPGTYTVSLTTTGSGVSTTKTMTVTVVATTADALGWWNDQVFYQVYPRSFFDTGGVVDSRNGGAIGDLQGLIQKLDYLNDGNASTTTDLGVTALYIMPVHDATQPWFGGYEVNDYKSIIAELGAKVDFDQFVAAAHARGMKVIMDMVFNHTSLQNTWFTQGNAGASSQFSDYYVHQATAPSGNWYSNPVGHTDANFNYYYAFFGQTTADLNFNNASVRNTIKDVSKYWLDQKADGFRVDAPMFLYEKNNGIGEDDQRNLPATYEYFRNWRKYLKDNANTSVQVNPFSVGETWLPNKNDVPTAAKYVYQGFDIGFQFDIAYGVQYALNNENKNALQGPVEQSMQYYPFLQFGVMLSNHDMGANGDGGNPKRLKDRLINNQDAKAKVAAAFLLTTPGVPFVYFGDEIGAAGNAWSRAPMRWTPGANAGFTAGSSPWEPIGADYTTNNVQTQDATAGSLLKLYRNLIKVRMASTALRQGKYTTVSNASTSVYSFARTAGSETVVVLLNMAAAAQQNVALSVTLPNGVPNGTYSLTNLLDVTQPAAASVTVANGSISNWTPFATIGANAYYVLRLNTTAGPNAAPTVAAIANQTLNIESGAQAVGLTGVSDGDYCTQTLTATASSATTTVVGNPGVTTSCAAGTGTLTLTPLAVGTSTIILTLTDNGGTANGGVNTASRSFTATVTDVPRAPTGLAIAQASPASAGLTWTDNSTRETGYKVYWSTSATKPATPNASIAANSTSYTATGLSTQTTYNFWVEAYSASGSSAAITGTLALTLPNLALNKTATASNTETFNGVTYSPSLAVDGTDNSFSSRWSAAGASPANANQVEWIKVDLGASYDLSRVTVSWENANADSYYIMASSSNIAPDPTNAAWAKVNFTGLPNQARLDNQTVAITGRYLAIYCYHKTQQYGYSIYELQAYGVAASGNQAPVANAGPDQSKAAGTTSATLTATGSSDPEGSPLTYAWTKVSGPAATFSSTTAVLPTVSGLTNGSTYVFQVSVSDGALAATDQVQVIVAAPPTGTTAYYLINRWKGTYLYDDNQQVKYAAAAAGTAYQWNLESFNGNQRIKNVGTGRYLNVEGQLAYVESSTIPDSYTSGQWVLEPYAGYTRIRNVWKGTYVNVENQTGFAQCYAVDASFYSGHWTFQPVPGGRSALASSSAAPAKAPLVIYPNPISRGTLTLLLPTRAATARLRLLDGQGHVVLDREAPVAGGQTGLDVTGLATGLYLLQATADGTTCTGKVAIE